jgi:putative FmdB family regulatory protein
MGVSMPIFEYRCQECGHKFEAILFGEQKPECPKCHTAKLEQQLSTFAVSKSSNATPAAGCGQSNCCMMNGDCSVN